MTAEGTKAAAFNEVYADGKATRTIDRSLIEEAPVAVEINGLGYAVMMVTPINLEDFAIGFCLSEQLIKSEDEFMSAEASKIESKGWVLRIQLVAESAAPLYERARLRLSEGSCGLCGIESLEQVLRPLPHVAAKLEVKPSAIFRAAKELEPLQHLGMATRAAHAAALCDPDGHVLLVREDAGRHNAFDKLLGAAARAKLSVPDCFVFLTARCSFELVQKAVIAGCPMLVTISAASTLAVDHAQRQGLKLISLARADSYLELAQRIAD